MMDFGLHFNNFRYSSGCLCVFFLSSLFLIFLTTRSHAPTTAASIIAYGIHESNHMRQFLGKKESSFDIYERSISELTKFYTDGSRKIIKKSVANQTMLHEAVQPRSLKALIPELGGNPMRTFIVTTWRSGSTFIGDLINSNPAIFYHYEPLLPEGIHRIRGDREAQQAKEHLRRILRCDYSNMTEYLKYGLDHPMMWIHTSSIWQGCSEFNLLCLEPNFLKSICSVHPMQSIKTVRLSLNVVKGLMEEKGLNLRVILLVRDPRGTWQSRQQRDWCPGQPDCEDPALLCQDLVDDYNTAKKMADIYANNFRVLRYEDLAFDVYNMSSKVLDFLHLKYTEQTQNFLDTHTRSDAGGVSSTYRNTKTAPIHWRNDLSWRNVSYIQDKCKEAIKLWGYLMAKDEASLMTLKPVGKLKFPKVLLES